MDGAEIAGPVLAPDKAYRVVAHRARTHELAPLVMPGAPAGRHAVGRPRPVRVLRRGHTAVVGPKGGRRGRGERRYRRARPSGDPPEYGIIASVNIQGQHARLRTARAPPDVAAQGRRQQLSAETDPPGRHRVLDRTSEQGPGCGQPWRDGIILRSDRAPEDQQTVGLEPLRHRLTRIRATDLKYDSLSGQPLADPSRASSRFMLDHEHPRDRFIGLLMADTPQVARGMLVGGLGEVIDHCASLMPLVGERRSAARSTLELAAP